MAEGTGTFPARFPEEIVMAINRDGIELAGDSPRCINLGASHPIGFGSV